MNTTTASAAPPPRNSEPRRVDPASAAVAPPRAAEAADPARQSAGPPHRRWPGSLILFALLLAAAVPMLWGIGDAPVRDASEAWLLDTSRETWQRAVAWGDESWSVSRFLPVRAGEPVLHEAPGQVWMTVAAWLPADAETAARPELVLRARLLSAGMILLAVAAVFWAGHALGGLPVAGLATLVVVANPLLTLAGRTANGEALVLGWTMLAGAAALWAMRPMKPAAAVGRQGFGWAICGGALGMTALVGGIDAALPAVLPLCLLVLLCPRRPGNALGLLVAGAIAGLMVLPWVVHVHEHRPDMWQAWLDRVSPTQPWSGTTLWERAVERGTLIASAWGVWGLVVVLALIWPFMPGASAGAGALEQAQKQGGKSRKEPAMIGRLSHVPGPRRRLFVGWGWLVGVTAMVLLAPAGMTAGVVLATLPIGALAAGQALWSVSQAAGQGQRVWVWRVLAGTTAGVLLLASGALPWAMASLPELVDRGWLASVFAGAMSPWFWVVSGVLLAVLALGGLVLALGDRPARTAVCWSAWSLVATTAVMVAVARGPGVAMIRLHESGTPPTGDPVKEAAAADADTPLHPESSDPGDAALRRWRAS